MENIEDIYDVSAMQHGMLFHSLYSPEDDVFVEQLSYTLDGALNVAALKYAWQTVLDRNPVLRTGFLWEDLDAPVQVVRKEVELPWTFEDWSDRSADAQQTRLQELYDAERKNNFDLNRAPLMRCKLIRLAPDRHRFIWTYHHLLSDGWGVSPIKEEVFAFYEARCRGEELQMERRRPYKDYIAHLKKQNPHGAETYWKENFKDFSAPTPLGVDRRIGSEKGTCRNLDLRLSPAQTAALQQLAKQNQLTVNTIVTGAWVALLGCYSGKNDVVFGAVISGRPAELTGVESMPGMFINTLPVRMQLPDDAQLLPWLKDLQLRQVQLDRHAATPLIDIQGWSAVPRGLPLFESIVIFQNYPIDASLEQFSGSLKISDVHFVLRSNYPLTLEVTPGEQLLLNIVYESGRFTPDTIRRMLDHLQNLLAVFVRFPDGKLPDFSPLTATERKQILTDWNNSAADFPADKTLPELFEAQVAKNPDNLAVAFHDKILTYAEFNSRVNHIAHALRDAGVKPETIVALLGERSADLMTGILGILKAGGVYLPLDPRHPARRQRQVLEQSGAAHLLYTDEFSAHVEELLADLPPDDRPTAHAWKEIQERDPKTTNPPPCCLPEHLAYVIYTSGSTGLPKGAMLEHRGMVNHLYAKIHELHIVETDVVAETAPQCFDISIWQFFVALPVGGCVRIFDDETTHDPLRLIAETDRCDVTVLETVPSMLQAVLNEKRTAAFRLSRLRWCVVTGEALPPELCREWFSGRPNIPLNNVYGPTECSDDVSHRAIHEPLPEFTVNTPIGRPVDNTQLYVLDRRMQPLPANVPGELYVGGVGVGRGYLGDSIKTAAVFLPDPFRDSPGSRLYRTGDLVRFAPDGEIEFLGRVDHQVKIRGNRIELGEIESVIREHPGVREVAVLAREDRPGEKRLVAYLTAADSNGDPITSLREKLQEQLPDYMAPSAYMTLEKFPLTPNGKLDRSALPIPEVSAAPQNYVAPRNPVEEQLVRIWSEVLGVERIGVFNNFFELGGHSLLAIQVISRVRDALSVDTTLRRLFQAPTISQFAELIENSLKAGPVEQAPAITRISRDQHRVQLSSQGVIDIKKTMNTDA